MNKAACDKRLTPGEVTAAPSRLLDAITDDVIVQVKSRITTLITTRCKKISTSGFFVLYETKM